jgi:GT2 family glycosyltransferase
MSKLHIIIPIINQHIMTQQAIDSINCNCNYSIHIIDQDSNIETKEYFEKKQNSSDFWVHRFSPKVSLSEAWNYGIMEASKDLDCEYFFIINNDVIFHKDTINNLIDSLIHTQYAMVTCNNVAPKMSLDEFKNMNIDNNSDFDFLPITNWREEGPDFSAFMINRKTINDIGWFDENYKPAYWEDCDYHIRIQRANKHARRISRSPFYHFGSVTARNTGVTSGYSERIYIEKWGSINHGEVMDGQGFLNPYNDNNKNYKYWKGCEKYNLINI